MNNEMLELDISDGVANLSMTHGKVNAMNLEFVTCLNKQLGELADNEEVRQVVLGGNPKVFSAGVDLKRLVDESVSYLDQFLPELVQLFLTAFEFPKPLIVAITGHAVAGGCVLGCAADYRIIASRARIGVPELRVGVPFPSAGMEIMRWAANPSAFRKMIGTGATFTGPEAVAVGLADDSVDSEHIHKAARDAIEPFSVVPPDVFRLTKRQMRQPIVDRIRRSEQLFGEEINRLWRADATRQAVTEYVVQRLTG